VARVLNETRGEVLGRRVEVAESFVRRLRGLLGRRGWGPSDGMWIEPCAGVHGLGMSFAIDVVLIDEGLHAIWVQTLHPWRLGRIHLDARAALELPVGTLARTGTSPGDRLRIERTSRDDEQVDNDRGPLIG
jgi:uncharacterized protein